MITEETREGMERAVRHSGEEWKEYALAFVEKYCETHRHVFVDDIWDAGLEEPEQPLAIGGVINSASHKGWIQPLRHGKYYCTLPSNRRGHTQQKQVWESLIYKEPVHEGQGELWKL